MSKSVVLTAVGRDRVGIVARVAAVFFELGCNLLDSSMTLLRGEFAIILMVSLPADTTVEQLRAKIPALERELGMNIHLRELNDEELTESAAEGNPHIISVYGADKPGIVSGVTRELAELGVNITDVQTKYSGSRSGGNNPVFMMILEVDVPASVATAKLEQSLKSSCNSLGMDITVQALEVMEL
ncbi:MAG TPA: ACT domain-containing protein [Planktothrix sp.]|jgi:glycine cleavage system transcriptional repressor